MWKPSLLPAIIPDFARPHCWFAASQLPTWAQLRQLGAGLWLRDPKLLASTAEQLAKQQFAERRCADDCALLYCALAKRSVLQVRVSVGCSMTTSAPCASAHGPHVYWGCCVRACCRACIAAHRTASQPSSWPGTFRRKQTGKQLRQAGSEGGSAASELHVLAMYCACEVHPLLGTPAEERVCPAWPAPARAGSCLLHLG